MKTEFNLTPLQRLEIYRQALSMIENRECLGLCHALLINSLHIFSPFDYSLEFFPEIKKHEVNEKDWWFPLDEYGRTQRIKILKLAIEETAVKHLESQK